MTRAITLLAVLALTIVACTSAGVAAPSSDAPEPPTEAPSMSPSPGNPSAGSGNLSAAIVDPIVADAATRADVAPSEVVVISAEPVTWPDGGLGCPLPGLVYPQVLVDGYQVIVQAGQRTFDYRGSAPGRFRLCLAPG